MIRKIRIASNKKHSIPNTGSNKIISKTCNIAKISEKVKPSTAGTTLNVTHKMKRNIKIENNILIITPPNNNFCIYQDQVLSFIMLSLCISLLATILYQMHTK